MKVLSWENGQKSTKCWGFFYFFISGIAFVAEKNSVREQESCQFTVFNRPGVIRSIIREDTGDAWNVIWQLPSDSVTKPSLNSSSLSWCFTV